MSLYIWKLISENKVKIPNTPWTVICYSRAARHTFLYIPELYIAFDAGLASEVHPTTIFISHAHIDHVRELWSYVIEPVKGNPTVVVPRSSADDIKTFVNSAIHMTKHNRKAQVAWNVVEASIPKEVTSSVFLPNIMSINKLNFKIELFKCTHSIPTTGYGMIEVRSKLKPEFVGLPQKEIESLKLNGIQICMNVDVPHFVVLGDTDHRVFYKDTKCTIFNSDLEKYSTIMVECTFLTDNKAKDAKDKKHMLWSRLFPFIHAHPNITFMLYHFSMCYRDAEIIQFFKALNIPNVIPLITDLEHIIGKNISDNDKCCSCGNRSLIDEIGQYECDNVSDCGDHDEQDMVTDVSDTVVDVPNVVAVDGVEQLVIPVTNA